MEKLPTRVSLSLCSTCVSESLLVRMLCRATQALRVPAVHTQCTFPTLLCVSHRHTLILQGTARPFHRPPIPKSSFRTSHGTLASCSTKFTPSDASSHMTTISTKIHPHRTLRSSSAEPIPVRAITICRQGCASGYASDIKGV